MRCEIEFKVLGRGFSKGNHEWIQAHSEYKVQDFGKGEPSSPFMIPCEITEQFDSLTV